MLTNRSGLRWDEGLSCLDGRQLESPGTLDYLYRIVHRQAMSDALPGVFYAYNDSGFRLALRITGADFTAKMLERPKLGDNRKSSYTRGLVVGSHRGENYFSHTGGYYAYTGLYLFPSYDLVIAFASNRDDVVPAETAFRIFDVLHPDQRVQTPDPLNSFVDGKETRPLNGIYVNPDTGLVFNATSRGGVILLNHSGRGAYLSPVSNNTFIAGPGVHSAKVIINNGTAVVSADLYDGNMRTFQPVLRQPANCKEFTALVGVYYSDDTGAVVEITSKDNKLIMNTADHPTLDFEIGLMRLLPHVLIADHISLIIGSLKDTRIQGFALHAHGAHDIKYRRIG